MRRLNRLEDLTQCLTVEKEVKCRSHGPAEAEVMRLGTAYLHLPAPRRQELSALMTTSWRSSLLSMNMLKANQAKLDHYNINLNPKGQRVDLGTLGIH
jgi:hypothetical protein